MNVRTINRRHTTVFLIVTTFNMLLMVYGAVTRSGIASFILFVFIGNLLIYKAYYTIMKIIYRERIPHITIFCVVIVALTSLPALYLFKSKQGNVQQSSDLCSLLRLA